MVEEVVKEIHHHLLELVNQVVLVVELDNLIILPNRHYMVMVYLAKEIEGVYLYILQQLQVILVVAEEVEHLLLVDKLLLLLHRLQLVVQAVQVQQILLQDLL